MFSTHVFNEFIDGFLADHIGSDPDVLTKVLDLVDWPDFLALLDHLYSSNNALARTDALGRHKPSSRSTRSTREVMGHRARWDVLAADSLGFAETLGRF